MADDASILRAAEAERDHADMLRADHVRVCKCPPCDDCRSLAYHAARTQRQVELLAGAEPEMEALFDA